MKSIRLFKPSIGSDELVEIKKTFDASWIGYGQKVKKFEDMWKDKFNTKYAIAVNSCTAALHASLAVNNFKKRILRKKYHKKLCFSFQRIKYCFLLINLLICSS